MNPNMSPPKKFSSKSKSNQIKDILPGKISNITTKNIPINQKVIKSRSLPINTIAEVLTQSFLHIFGDRLSKTAFKEDDGERQKQINRALKEG